MRENFPDNFLRPGPVLDQLLERIRDAVQREALQQERERVAAELERGDLVLVVFDTLRADRLGFYGHSSPTSPEFAIVWTTVPCEASSTCR